MRKSIILSALAAALLTSFTSCNSDSTVTSDNNQLNDSNVVVSDAAALSLVNGVYAHWQPLSSSFTFIIELQSNKMISFEGEENEAGPLNSRFEAGPDK